MSARRAKEEVVSDTEDQWEAFQTARSAAGLDAMQRANLALDSVTSFMSTIARRADMKDIVNTKIKFREPYRPFAPSVLAEAAERYFELPDACTKNATTGSPLRLKEVLSTTWTNSCSPQWRTGRWC